MIGANLCAKAINLSLLTSLAIEELMCFNHIHEKYVTQCDAPEQLH